jgi:hypothetical protein
MGRGIKFHVMRVSFQEMSDIGRMESQPCASDMLYSCDSELRFLVADQPNCAIAFSCITQQQPDYKQSAFSSSRQELRVLKS